MKVKLEHDVQIRGDLKAKLYCYIDDDTKQPIVYTSITSSNGGSVTKEQFETVRNSVKPLSEKVFDLAKEIVDLL